MHALRTLKRWKTWVLCNQELGISLHMDIFLFYSALQECPLGLETGSWWIQWNFNGCLNALLNWIEDFKIQKSYANTNLNRHVNLTMFVSTDTEGGTKRARD